MFTDLREYILIIENIVPEELCDEILSEFNTDSNWKNTVTGSGLARDIRRCDAIHITDKNVIQQNQDVRESIDAKLFLCAGEALAKYKEKFSLSVIQGDSGYTLLRYQEGEFYSEHTDHFLHAPRSISCSFALNDGYEGGEWGFFNREIVIKAPKGSAVMFPSNFMYPHEIVPVTKGVRYSVITWFI